jgi:hypothetical protein
MSQATWDEQRDGARIAKQRDDIWNAIRDGNWYTLSQLEQTTGHPQSSISARLRDFRKARYGSHRIERGYVDRGLWQYRLADNVQIEMAL